MRVGGLIAAFSLVVASPGPAAAGGGPPYDLSRVRGIEEFPQDHALRKLLSQNGFAVILKPGCEFWWIYCKARCSRYPAFITTDSAFRIYESLVAEAFLVLEESQARALKEITKELFERFARLEVPAVRLFKEARNLVLAYLAVGLRLQGGLPDFRGVPESSRALAEAELKNIEAGRTAVSPIFGPLRGSPEGYLVYGFLKPSGFYRESPGLSRFFRASKWFGVTSFRVKSRKETACAFLLALLLERNPVLAEKLKSYLLPYEAFIGPPDDISFLEAASVLERMLGPGGAELENPLDLLESFRKEILRLRRPRINDQVLDQRTFCSAFEEATFGVRLLPGNYTWETHFATEFARRLQMPLSPWHIGLALGDENSGDLVSEYYEALGSGRNGGADELYSGEQIGRRFWRESPVSLYHRSLEALEELARPPEQGPFFCKTPAWRYKSSYSLLGSWTSFRGIWQLHAKDLSEVFGVAEMGRRSPFVSPYPRFFLKLARASRAARKLLLTLEAFKTAGKKASFSVERFRDFSELLEKLASISRKQARGEGLSSEEKRCMSRYLDFLEGVVMDSVLKLPVKVRFAADVTNPHDTIERYFVGGPAYPIYVIRRAPREVVKREGGYVVIPEGLQLYEGAVFGFSCTVRNERTGAERHLEFPSRRRFALGLGRPSEKERAEPKTPKGRHGPDRGSSPAEPAWDLDDPELMIRLAGESENPELVLSVTEWMSEAQRKAVWSCLSQKTLQTKQEIVFAFRCMPEDLDVEVADRVFGDTEFGRLAFLMALKVKRKGRGLLEAAALGHPNFKARAAACVALGAFKDSTDVLVKALEDESAVVRFCACLSLINQKREIGRVAGLLRWFETEIDKAKAERDLKLLYKELDSLGVPAEGFWFFDRGGSLGRRLLGFLYLSFPENLSRLLPFLPDFLITGDARLISWILAESKGTELQVLRKTLLQTALSEEKPAIARRTALLCLADFVLSDTELLKLKPLLHQRDELLSLCAAVVILGWEPEDSGFPPDRIQEVIKKAEKRLEALERAPARENPRPGKGRR